MRKLPQRRRIALPGEQQTALLLIARNTKSCQRSGKSFARLTSRTHRISLAGTPRGKPEPESQQTCDWKQTPEHERGECQGCTHLVRTRQRIARNCIRSAWRRKRDG